MNALERLRARPGVVLDTMVFIHFLEDSPPHAGLCEEILRRMARGSFTDVITPITFSELLVKPLRQNRTDIARRYRQSLAALPHLLPVSLDADTGIMAGALRAKYELPLPDLLQVAAALRFARPALVTGDRALKKVDEIDVFLLDDLASG